MHAGEPVTIGGPIPNYSVYVASEDLLYNPRLRRRYDVVDGIPVMLVEEATSLTEAENDRLSALVQDLKIAPTFDEKSS